MEKVRKLDKEEAKGIRSEDYPESVLKMVPNCLFRSIRFLYPPHRGYISFVNTCGTHRNIDLRP